MGATTFVRGRGGRGAAPAQDLHRRRLTPERSERRCVPASRARGPGCLCCLIPLPDHSDNQQISDGAPKSALSSLLTGATDPVAEERVARERARMLLADVASVVTPGVWSHYDVADGI